MLTRRALLVLLLAAPVQAQEAAPPPPAAKKVPHTTRVHGETLKDDYFWMRERKSPEVLAHLEAENAYAEAMTRYLRPMQETLYGELLGRIEQTDLTVPARDRGYFYYSRTEEGKQYPIYCRKKRSLDAAQEVVLDGNGVAKGQKFFRLASTAFSDDGSRVAFTTDFTAFREFYLSVKDLVTGKLIEDRARKGSQLVWAADGKTLFYVADDHAKRPCRLYRHLVGSDRDDLVYEEKDELFRVGLTRTRDHKYLIITSRSSRTAEVRYLPTTAPALTPKLLRPRKEGVLYSVDHRDSLFYIRTNEGGAHNFKLVTAPVAKPNEWTELIAHRPDVTLGGVILFKDHAVLQERQDGLPHLVVRELAGGVTHRISAPEPVYSMSPAGNPEYDTTTFRFSYQSLVTPLSV